MDRPASAAIRPRSRNRETARREHPFGQRDDHRIDFIYLFDGLASFTTEWKRAVPIEWAGSVVKVLPLERLIRTKEASGRPKDAIHLAVLRDFLASKKLLRR